MFNMCWSLSRTQTPPPANLTSDLFVEERGPQHFKNQTLPTICCQKEVTFDHDDHEETTAVAVCSSLIAVVFIYLVLTDEITAGLRSILKAAIALR